MTVSEFLLNWLKFAKCSKHFENFDKQLRLSTSLSGDVPTPLAEAKEYCEMRQRQTPKITKFSFSMGKQYVSPFQDKEPMRIFLEKCRSRCPSMTTFEESRKTVGEIQTIDDSLDC